MDRQNWFDVSFQTISDSLEWFDFQWNTETNVKSQTVSGLLSTHLKQVNALTQTK
jgi:hypothetical protein